jgi:hypothetical protein
MDDFRIPIPEAIGFAGRIEEFVIGREGSRDDDASTILILEVLGFVCGIEKFPLGPEG